MVNQSGSARSKQLTLDDCEVLAEVFGFASASDFIKFASAQQDKADHPVRKLSSDEVVTEVMRRSRPPMVYGSGRA
jgi:hypothetical protein